MRTVVMSWDLENEKRLSEFLAANYRLVEHVRYIKDDAAALKNSFVRNQPEWRIELLQYERADAAEPS